MAVLKEDLHFSVLISLSIPTDRGARFEPCGRRFTHASNPWSWSALRVRDILQGSNSAENSPHRVAAPDYTAFRYGNLEQSEVPTFISLLFYFSCFVSSGRRLDPVQTPYRAPAKVILAANN